MLGDNILSIEELRKLSTINVISYINRIQERRRIIFQNQQAIDHLEKEKMDKAYNEGINVLKEKTR